MFWLHTSKPLSEGRHHSEVLELVSQVLLASRRANIRVTKSLHAWIMFRRPAFVGVAP